MSVWLRERRLKNGDVDKQWFVDVKFKRANSGSVRVRRRSPVQSKRGAEAFERQLREQLLKYDGKLDEEVKPKEIPTVQRFWPEYEAWSSVNNKPSNQNSKRIIMKNHLLPFFGRMRLDEIGPQQIEQFKAKEVADEKKPSTINNYLTVLRKMLDVAVDYGLLKHVPRVKWMKVPKPEFEFLDFDEAPRLIAAADPEWKAMIVMGLRTGMRIGELKAVRWGDIDLVSGRVIVRRAAWHDTIGTPKSGKNREVPLSDDCVAALKEHKLRTFMKSELVFCQPDGSLLREEMVRHPLLRAIKRAGLRHFGWHALRHTFASHLVMNGVPMKAVQELMGHSTMEMTMRYSHLSPDVRRDAVRTLDASWRKPGAPLGHRRRAERKPLDFSRG